jgi:hypothetical protein
VELNKLTLIPEIFQPNLAFAGDVEILTNSPSIEKATHWQKIFPGTNTCLSFCETEKKFYNINTEAPS